MPVGSNKRITRRLAGGKLSDTQRATLQKRQANNRADAIKGKAYTGGKGGPLNSGAPATLGKPQKGTRKAAKRSGVLTGKTGVNTVASGAGSARKGQEYKVGRSGDSYFHQYESGQKVYLSKDVAAKYGYGKKDATPVDNTTVKSKGKGTKADLQKARRSAKRASAKKMVS